MKVLKESIKNEFTKRPEEEEENPIYTIRKVAARFYEMHHGDASYTPAQLRADVATTLRGQGKDVTDATIDEVLRGISL